MEMEQVQKVVRLNENSKGNEDEIEIDDGGETSDNELSDMDKLPNEILIKILNYLDEKELVKCRLLSSRWNEISCLLLQDKSERDPYLKLAVKLQKDCTLKYLQCKTVITRSFDEFLDCFATTEANPRRPFPFSRFKITDLYFMEMNQMTQFVSLFTHIKKLELDIKKRDLKNFGMFWRLLLKFAPNIKYLGLLGDQWINVELFEPYFNFKGDSDPLHQKEDNKTFLDKLKVFRINLQHVFEIEFYAINFLKHAPNVQEIINYYDPSCVVGLWKELNKELWLKQLDIDHDFESDVPAAELMKNLQLEDLRADCILYSNPQKNEKAMNYIHHALKSSQDSLFSLDLYELTVESMNVHFKGIKSLPNVRQLEIRIQAELEMTTESRNVLDRLRHLCPNVTNLDFGFFRGDFSQVAPILWTGFKGLKYLKCSLGIIDEKHNLIMDSAFSGYSQESIQKIQTKLGDGISLEEARRNEKQNSSILDLKDLRRLELEFVLDEKSAETEKQENQLWNSVFIKILPQHIRENPTSIIFDYFM